MQSDDLTTTQGIAGIALFLVLLVPMAVALAWWFKRRYTRAVIRLQAATARGIPTHEAHSGAGAVTPATPAAPLQIAIRPAENMQDADSTKVPRRLRRRVLGVQFFTGLLYWWSLILFMVIGLLWYAHVTGDKSESSSETSALATLLVLPPLLLLPPLLAYALQAGMRERAVWLTTALSLIAVAVGLRLTGISLFGAFGTASVMAVLALTITAFLRPAVRGAGPSLVTAMTIGFLVVSVIAALFAMIGNSPTDGSFIDWADWTGNLRDLAALLAALALGVWVSYRMLLRLARRYAEKRFSELQLALGAYWGLVTLFAAFAVFILSFEDKTGAFMEWVGFGVLLMWLAWRVSQRWGLRWAVRRAAPGLPPLVLFRVFKPSERSEAFMDRFLARWRFAAPVWLIGGPDLAGAFMEPDEFFAWLRRRLDHQFIRASDNIHERLDALDSARDPDGRFRVHELFCANDAWQQTALAMIERAGVVMLDLREYSEARAGTRFELYELLRRAPLDRVLLLTDEAGDAPRLRAALQAAWADVGRALPGDAAKIQVLQVHHDKPAAIRGLVAAVVRCAAGTPVA